MTRSAALFLIALFVSLLSFAQQAPTPTVPHLVRFAGIVTTGDGAPRAGTVGVMFSLYKDQQGGSALWTELQNVQLDANGHYTVLLGAQHPDGVPSELFTTNEARWLGIQVEADAEQPRILLVSVPYALKAGDAETLGGLPASAFVQTVTGGASGPSGAAPASPSTIVPYSINTSTSSGTAGYVARWSDASTLGNSALFDNGNLGIGTTSPASKLDIQTSSATPTNALNVASTLTNSTANSGIITALNLRVTDLSTATNVSKQTMRMNYIRDAAATGGVSVFDTIFTATPIINSDAPYTLIGLNMEAPNVAAGKTLGTFYGALIGAGGSSGTVTNRYALATAPGSGNVGLNTTTPIAPLNLVADNPGGAERATQFVVQGSTNPNLKLNIGLHTEASPAYADLSVVEENVAWRNLVLEKNGGNIGIGTTTPSSKLTVAGTIESTTGGIKFPDATVQATRGIPYVSGCTSGNVLGWNGSSWGCTAAGSGGGSGTVTSITAGSGITTGGSPITVSGTIAVDSTVARTNAANAFVGEQTFGGNIVGTGNLTLNGATSQLTITNGNKKFILGGFSGPAQVPNPEGGSGGSTTASGVNLVDDMNNELLVTGTGNTGLGLNALQRYATLNVANNTAIGYQTLFNETLGQNNVAVGASALYTDPSGNQNTAIGFSALYNNAGASGQSGGVGYYNTALGSYALYNNTTGNSNIALGQGAGSTLQTGNNNIYIGNPGPATPTPENPTVVGSESSRIRIGTPGLHTEAYIAGNLNLGGGVSLSGTGNGIVFPDGTKQTTASSSSYSAGNGITISSGTGGSTIAVDAIKVPLLTSANIFNNDQTITGNLTVSGGIFGNGSGLTNLSASNLSSGTLGAALLSGNYAINITGSAASAGVFTGNLTGDVTGTQTATTVTKLQGVSVSSAPPTGGQFLSFNGTAWQPASTSILSFLNRNAADSTSASIAASGGQLYSMTQSNTTPATAPRAVLKLADSTTSPGANDYLIIGQDTSTFSVSSGGTVKAAKFLGDGSQLTGLSGGGTITGITTATGSGLTGGDVTGTVTLSLVRTCQPGQILAWNGSAWACSTVSGGGGVSSITAGTGLTGGTITGSGTIAVDTAVVPRLDVANTFGSPQTITVSSGSGLAATTTGGSNDIGVVGSGYTGVKGIASGPVGVAIYGYTTSGTADAGLFVNSGSGGSILRAHNGSTNIFGVSNDARISLFPLSLATSTTGQPSSALEFQTSGWNSSINSPATSYLQWRANPVGNNSSTPSSSLNFYSGTNPVSMAATGLSLDSSGKFTFAPGQALPNVSLASCPSGDVMQGISNGSAVCIAQTVASVYGAGTGLTLNGNTFSVNFAGTGSGTGAARYDHNHDLAYVPWSGGTMTGTLNFASGQSFPGTASLNANTLNGTQTINPVSGNAIEAHGTIQGTGFFGVAGYASSTPGGAGIYGWSGNASAAGLFTSTAYGRPILRAVWEGNYDIFDVGTDARVMLPAKGQATNAAGTSSPALEFQTSAWNSNSNNPVTQYLQWRADPVGNNTAAPSSALNFYSGTDPTTLSATGLSLDSTGKFTFAAGQTLANMSLTSCSSGNVMQGITNGAAVCVAQPTSTSYTAGTGLTLASNAFNVNFAGTGAATTVARSDHNHTGTYQALVTSCSGNQVLKWSGSAWVCANDLNSGGTVTGVTAGTGLAGGTITGSGTIAIDSTVVAQRGVNNNFSTSQTINGSLTTSSGVTAPSFTYSSAVSGTYVALPTYCQRGISGAAPYQDVEVHNQPQNSLGPAVAISNTASGTYDFFCPVDLPVPAGATVTLTGATIGFLDNSATCLVGAEIRYRDWNPALYDMGTVVSSVYDGASSSDYAASGSYSKSFPSFTHVIGSSEVLWVRAIIGNTTGAGDCRYRGVQFTYTVNRP